MSFQSFHFLVFFVSCLALNALLWRRFTARKSLLLLASYYFYMALDWRLAGLLIYMTGLNYFCGMAVARASSDPARRVWLATAIAGSLGCLAVFKYLQFFVPTLVALLDTVGLHADGTLLSIALPVGLSFYTFQSLSYVLDVHARREGICTSLLDFALFVSFFPSVLSGPITRSRQFLPQLQDPSHCARVAINAGLPLMLRGLFKKIVLADVMAVHLVDPAFAAPANYSSAFLLVAAVGYSFQLYMDLSGYTDIARGAARSLGFELPENFKRPYLSRSVSEFWQRWHITMSSFFRDYLYFGLGGSKRGNVYVNLMLTFVAIGIWHGAGWDFVTYGALHGAVICLERAWRNTTAEGHVAGSIPRVQVAAMVAGTFAFVALSRILFRADDWNSAIVFGASLISGQTGDAPWSLMSLSALLISVALHGVPQEWSDAMITRFSAAPALVQATMGVLVLFATTAMSGGRSGFLYFQF